MPTTLPPPAPVQHGPKPAPVHGPSLKMVLMIVAAVTAVIVLIVLAVVLTRWLGSPTTNNNPPTNPVSDGDRAKRVKDTLNAKQSDMRVVKAEEWDEVQLHIKDLENEIRAKTAELEKERAAREKAEENLRVYEEAQRALQEKLKK